MKITRRTFASAALALPFMPCLSCLAAALPALSPKDKHQADDEMKQGADVAAEVAKQMTLITSGPEFDRVNSIGQRLAPVADSTVIKANFGNDRVYPFNYKFHVVDSKDVNAFSLPGGYIYVNSGLVKMVRSDDELAGVLGHEITHAAHHHVQALSHEQSKMSTEMALGLIAALLAHVNPTDIANLSSGASLAQTGVLNNKYSEAAERDADHGGLIIMQKAGYNPVGMLTFMESLEDMERRGPNVELGILRDHPFTKERVAAIRTELADFDVPVTVRAVREVSGAPRASIKSSGPGATDILFNGQKIATLADPGGTRAKAIASDFNGMLDGGLQLWQVKAEDGVVIAADRPLLTITRADVALTPGATAESLAQNASRAIRSGLYAQGFSAGAP